MFDNHGFKKWISLKIMLLWLWKLIIALFMHVNNKGDTRLQFKENKFFRQVTPTSKKQLIIFQIQITPLLWRPQGCPEKQNYPLSLNLVVWSAKIGPKTEKLQKTVKKSSFFGVFLVICEVFWTFLVFDWFLAQKTSKFKLSGWFCFSRHPWGPWGPWGRQSRGVKPELANLVTVQK